MRETCCGFVALIFWMGHPCSISSPTFPNLTVIRLPDRAGWTTAGVNVRLRINGFTENRAQRVEGNSPVPRPMILWGSTRRFPELHNPVVIDFIKDEYGLTVTSEDVAKCLKRLAARDPARQASGGRCDDIPGGCSLYWDGEATGATVWVCPCWAKKEALSGAPSLLDATKVLKVINCNRGFRRSCNT